MRNWLVKSVFVYVFVYQLLWLLGGCSDLSSTEQVKRFEQAGLMTSERETEGDSKPKAHIGPYRVVPGDVLEFQMPAVLRVISSDLSEWLRPMTGHYDVEPYLVRVNETGTITLPIIGRIAVGGKTLSEIESLVINAYYPRYVVNPPMVVCEIKKYRRENERVFTVMGLVNKPDAFPYPPDVQYNLMEAIAFAGGLDMVADPRYVKVYRQSEDGEVVEATFGIDGKSLTKAYGVIIKPGDVIYVDHTLRTRTNKFLSEVFRITIGADFHGSNND